MTDERTPSATQLASRVRGLMLGLALGDATGDELAQPGVLRAGVATQLAAFTAEGLIRASQRAHHRGICHPPSVVWHAYCRWSYGQGLHPEVMRSRWRGGSEEWPDGWLAQVSLLRERRGSAPATVQALAGETQGEYDAPVTASLGSHALTRTLPTAAFVTATETPHLAREIAALTHAPEASDIASLGVEIAGQLILGEDPDVGLHAVRGLLAQSASRRMQEVLAAAESRRGVAKAVAALAPDGTSESALAAAALVLLTHPAREQIEEALGLARHGSDPRAVAATLGALLGAVHGVEALPVGALSRLELAWTMDTLARDAVAECTTRPGGGEYMEAEDPHWWGRYPGW